jgi:hypothetical protein
MACGKHRGRVVDNIDPEQMGRLVVEVPGVTDGPLRAMPCVPYAGPGVGFVALPPPGAGVWVEFENDDPTLPIWTGCFWGSGEMPDGTGLPEKKVIRTEGVSLVLDDTPGAGFSLVVETGPATLTLTMSGTEIRISNGLGADISMSGPNVNINEGALGVT